MERVWCGLDVVHSVFDMVSPTLVLHSFCPNKQGRKEEEKEFESEKGMVKDQRHTGVGDGLMKAQWLMCCMPHTTLHSTPSTLWSTPFFTHRQRQKSGVVKGEEKGRVVVVWCGQSDGMSKPCKTQPTHNTTHKPHMPPTPSITHPQHQQVHPHSPFLLCLCVCGVQRRGKGWWLVVGKSTKKGGMVDGRVGWCHQSTHPSTTLCVACSATMWSIHQSIPTTHTPHTGDGWDGGVVDEGMRGV